MSYTRAHEHMHSHMPSENMGIKKSVTLSPEMEEAREREFYASRLFYPCFSLRG